MDIAGKVGSSPVAWDFSVDGSLNIVSSLSYVDPVSAAYVKVSGGAPASAILDQLVAKLNSPVATEIEQGLVSAIKLYLASQPQSSPPAAS